MTTPSTTRRPSPTNHGRTTSHGLQAVRLPHRQPRSHSFPVPAIRAAATSIIAFALVIFGSAPAAPAQALKQLGGQKVKEQAKQRAAAQTDIVHEEVTVSRAGAKIACYLARPATDQPAPGLVLIHEWWGLNDWVRQQADRFAQKGYATLAVDLYRGEVAADSEHAHELMRGLPDERAVADLRAAFAYLAKHSATKGKSIGAIGWCMGGGFSLKLAIAEPKLACCVVCYGRPVTDEKELRKIKGPLLGIWGATDRGIDVEPFKKALRRAGVEATHHVYPGAGHGFLNENNKRGYNAAQAARAWQEIDAFFAKHLL